MAVSTAALLGEALAVGAGQAMYDLTREPAGPGGIGFLLPVVLPFLLLFGLVLGAFAGFVVTVTLVLPTLWLAGWAHRRAGRPGRPAWWCTVAATPFAAFGATVVYGVFFLMVHRTTEPPGFSLFLWLLLTAAAVPAALLAAYAARDRAARRAVRLTATVAGGAIGVALTVVVLFAVAFATGLMHEYRAPHLDRAALTGVWQDGSGGTLRLRSDGAASASRLDVDGVRCEGAGRWWSETASEQTVEVSGDICGQDWSIGGTQAKPTLYCYVGDPDEGKRLVLTRRAGARR
ncbi:hypothetical protein [Streptomyces sp. NPDC053427]|uniref:hypothetical protein n=1 Tax=Streptomyces sp. NPDC053427 TaxID=3365701 RepID=UPI0037D5B5B1